jgi:hypothetical protein
MQQHRGWLGFSYDPAVIRVDGERRPALVVIEVSQDSPAEGAGLLVGDTIYAINDLRVTDAFMQSLGSTLESGDAVRIRVRSRNRDRTLSMNADNRPAGLDQFERMPYPAFGPDEVRARVRVFLDSARIFMDTTHLPRIHVERLPDGSTIYMYGDSTLRFRRFQFDTLGSGSRQPGVWLFSPDTFRLRADSALLRSLPSYDVRGRGGMIRIDSLMRLRGDTLGNQLRAMPRGRIYGLSRDSLFTFQPGDSRGTFGMSVFGTRAVGGAELTEINPDLGSYFGTDHGVLVVRVPRDTPAHRAGLEAGDVITAVNGRSIESVMQLNRAITERSNSAVRLEILRKNQRRTIELRDD